METTWLEVYKIFESIVDYYFEKSANCELLENIARDIDHLYSIHAGEKDWDLAYERWIASADDDAEM